MPLLPPASTDAVERLEQLIRDLRSPQGCPWDREQTLEQARAQLLEEAHEVAQALDEVQREEPDARSAANNLREELGDLFFQVAFLCELAGAELGSGFELARVVEGVVDKMIERHPHVYGEAAPLATPQEVKRAWERNKWERNKAAKADRSLLGGVPVTLPALIAALRLGEKAAAVGFDWNRAEEVVLKVQEELAELGQAPPERREEELGDLLFAIASLARHWRIDPERALLRGNEKFRRRFRHVEERLGSRLTGAADTTKQDELSSLEKHSTHPESASGEELSLRQEMERLWEEAKQVERGAAP